MKINQKRSRNTFRNLLVLLTFIGLAQESAFSEERVVFLHPRPLPEDINPRVPLSACGKWTGFYGPIDYRSALEPTRRRVESYHFDEYLPRFLAWPMNKPLDNYIGENFAYTLRAFPNHPTALFAMEQIGRRMGNDVFPGGNYPLECWYLRALQTVPSDPMVRAQYGIYLAYRDRPEEARRNLDIGDKGLCTSHTMQYQIGLANLEIKAYGRAQLNAMRAQKLGFQLNVLRDKLSNAGRWDSSLALPDTDTMDCDMSIVGTVGTPSSASNR